MAATSALVTEKVGVAPDFMALARTHYENFPAGSWLVPRAHRAHIHRIYAFARTADDLADEHRDAAALAAFRQSFADHLAGRASPEVALFSDLTRTVRERRLPEALLFDLLDAFALDLTCSRHDEASLLAYCAKSADPIGRLVLRVFGHADPALDRHSDAICTALQLLNHLQDIADDLALRDRIYFPREDLARFSVGEDALRAPRASPEVRALVQHWHGRIGAMFRAGWPLVEAVRGRLAVELRAVLWGAVLCLRRIEAAGFDVLATRARLPRWTRWSLPLRALLWPAPRELR